MWAARTLVRGVDVPASSIVIAGTVGANGVLGNGEATTASAEGVEVLSAAGGVLLGESGPAEFEHNGITYPAVGTAGGAWFRAYRETL
jgi:hypothetical protein